MKAKEMIVITVDAYDRAIEAKDEKIFDEAVLKIFKALVDDTKALSDARNARTDRAILAVVHEMDLKYQALVRAMPHAFKADGYRNMFKAVIDMGRQSGMWKGE